MLEEGHMRAIRCVEWSTCGSLLATASFDGTVVIWEVQDSKTKSSWDQVASLEGHDNEVKCVAWNKAKVVCVVVAVM